MRLSLCIVGCGDYAKTVLDEVHDLEGFEFRFASRDVAKAKAYCEAYGGAGYYGSYEEAMADPATQAVYLFTPHHLHLENARLAASNGKHVLVEKPIARTIAESRQLISAADDAGVTLMVAENYRFLSTVSRAKQIIGQGGIGDLRFIQIQDEAYSEQTGWRADALSMGGGVFIDGGIHSVDMLVNLAGYPSSVTAARPPQLFEDEDGEGEDGLIVMTRHPEGAAGLIYYSRATPRHGMVRWVAVTGTTGYLSFVPKGSEIFVESPEVRRKVPAGPAGTGVRPMLLEFRDAIDKGREPLMSGEEALKDLAVVLGAYESEDAGRTVALTPP